VAYGVDFMSPSENYWTGLLWTPWPYSLKGTPSMEVTVLVVVVTLRLLAWAVAVGNTVSKYT